MLITNTNGPDSVYKFGLLNLILFLGRLKVGRSVPSISQRRKGCDAYPALFGVGGSIGGLLTAQCTDNGPWNERGGWWEVGLGWEDEETTKQAGCQISCRKSSPACIRKKKNCWSEICFCVSLNRPSEQTELILTMPSGCSSGNITFTCLKPLS